jgi:hypothetical protein
LKRTLGSHKNKIIGFWIRLHNEELHNLYSSGNIIRMIKSRMMGGVGPVARMERKTNEYRILLGKTEITRKTYM